MQLRPARNTLASQLASPLARAPGLATPPHCHMPSSLVGASSTQGPDREGAGLPSTGQWPRRRQPGGTAAAPRSARPRPPRSRPRLSPRCPPAPSSVSARGPRLQAPWPPWRGPTNTLSPCTLGRRPSAGRKGRPERTRRPRQGTWGRPAWGGSLRASPAPTVPQDGAAAPARGERTVLCRFRQQLLPTTAVRHHARWQTRSESKARAAERAAGRRRPGVGRRQRRQLPGTRACARRRAGLVARGLCTAVPSLRQGAPRTPGRCCGNGQVTRLASEGIGDSPTLRRKVQRSPGDRQGPGLGTGHTLLKAGEQSSCLCCQRNV